MVQQQQPPQMSVTISGTGTDHDDSGERDHDVASSLPRSARRKSDQRYWHHP